MKKLALLLLSALLSGAAAFGASGSVDDAIKSAKAAASERKFDEALRLYEQAIAEHPEAPERWIAAQQGIAQTLAAKGDLKEAAKAAHLCMDGAPTPETFDAAVTLAAGILSALDQNVDRANQLLAFQQGGAAAAGPMEAVGYPSQPERERTLASLRQQAGDDSASSRLRAFTFLFTGKPREAFAQFADAFRRASSPRDLQTAEIDLVSTGWRALHGRRAGMESAIQYLLHGPAGGAKSPFDALLPAPPAPGEGGLAGLNPGELDALRRMRDACKLYAADPWVRGEMHGVALAALQRANDALDNWGEPGQKEWYAKLVFSADRQTAGPAALAGIQAAAKGRSLHLAGIAAQWAELDAYCKTNGIEPPRAMVSARGQFNALCTALEKLRTQPSAAKPLKTPARF
ncbi:MAG: hypothetical protein PHQ12_13030 [Chthoniobacteraceae bacterium]|nr:hypothetical protein [Chthoniobacteraceae bacterium]